jgi:hypothetical protein
LHVRIVCELLILLGLANGTPVLVHRLVGSRWSCPLDGGLMLSDQQRLFGSSKTIRGIVCSLFATAAGAVLLGMDWRLGAAIGALAMIGDLSSSFLKRRLRLPSGDRATGLDQIPESLFPVLAARHALSLSVLDILVTTAAFLLGEMALSVVFFRLHLRERPY